MQQTNNNCLAAFWQAAQTTMPQRWVGYRLSFDDPYGHYLVSELCLSDVPEGQCFALPVWIPGSYMVRDFAKQVVSITATADEQACELEMLDKSRWRLNQACKKLVIRMRVFAHDASVRSAWFDEQRAFVNGTSVFLRVEGREDWPCVVDIDKSSHAALATWQLATGLEVIEAESWGFGRYLASNYQWLVDCPIEAGEFDVYGFAAAGVPHVMLLAGNHHAVALDAERLVADLAAICEQQIALFTGDVPFNRYLFMTHVTQAGYGGLEHMNSTALVCAQRDLPREGAEVDAHYRQFLGLCSHEYFHSWNVKRLRPANLVQPNFQAENYTTLLWFFEGVTSYYDDLAVYRAGCITVEQWLEAVGQTITRVYRGEGRKGQTLENSSFTAWTRFYQQDANAPNAIVSYYAKGALVAMALDLRLRQLSSNRVSLDVLMRELWQQFGRDVRGMSEQDLEQAVAALLPDKGDLVKAFLHRAIRQTEDLPLQDWLADFAIELNWRAAAGTSDRGGCQAEPWRVWFGFAAKQQGNELELLRVDNGSPAHRSGLSVQDRVVAVNGFRPQLADIEQIQLEAQPGESVELLVFRENRLLRKSLQLDAAPQTTAVLALSENDDKAVAMRKEWLGC